MRLRVRLEIRARETRVFEPSASQNQGQPLVVPAGQTGHQRSRSGLHARLRTAETQLRSAPPAIPQASDAIQGRDRERTVEMGG